MSTVFIIFSFKKKNHKIISYAQHLNNNYNNYNKIIFPCRNTILHIFYCTTFKFM